LLVVDDDDKARGASQRQHYHLAVVKRERDRESQDVAKNFRAICRIRISVSAPREQSFIIGQPQRAPPPLPHQLLASKQRVYFLAV